MGKGLLMVAAIAATALTACNQGLDAAAQADLAELRLEVDRLSAENKSLDERLTALRSDVAVQGANRRIEREAWIPINGSGYALLQTSHGPLAMSITDVKPYANGSRLILQIGNLSPAAFSEVKFTVQYGPSAEDAEYLDMEKGKTMEWSVSNSIPGARWSLHTLTLEGVKPDELDHLWITHGEVTRIAF